MRWFGKNWHAPVNEESKEMPIPYRSTCRKCGERFDENSQGFETPGPGPNVCTYYHKDCFLETVLGPMWKEVVESTTSQD
jgi:hypothetical protein